MTTKQKSRFVELLQKDIDRHGGVDGFVTMLYDYNPNSIITRDVILDWLSGCKRPTQIKLNYLCLALSNSPTLFEERDRGSLVSEFLNLYYSTAGVSDCPNQTWYRKIEESIDNQLFEMYVGYVCDENHIASRFVPAGEWPEKFDKFLSSYILPVGPQWVQFANYEDLYKVLSNGLYNGKPIISSLVPVNIMITYNLSFFGIIKDDSLLGKGFGMKSDETKLSNILKSTWDNHLT